VRATYPRWFSSEITGERKPTAAGLTQVAWQNGCYSEDGGDVFSEQGTIGSS